MRSRDNHVKHASLIWDSDHWLPQPCVFQCFPGRFPSSTLLKVWFMESSTNISITWKLVRTTESQAPPQTYWMEICMLTKSHGDSWAPSSLRSTALEMVRCPVKENIFFLSEVTERGHMKRSWPTNNEKLKDQLKKKKFKVQTQIYLPSIDLLTYEPQLTQFLPSVCWEEMKSNTSSAVEDSQIYYHQSKYYYITFIHCVLYAMQLPRYFSTLFTLIYTWLWNLSS